MPSGTNIRQFVADLKTGKTNIARALDRLFGKNPARHRDDPTVASLVAWLKEVHALDQLIPAARALLQGLGVSQQELKHIDDWNNDQKEEVRQRLVDAIDHDHPYHFFWELHSGASEETLVPPLPDAGGDIVFRSPRSKVKLVSLVTVGEVKVDVG